MIRRTLKALWRRPAPAFAVFLLFTGRASGRVETTVEKAIFLKADKGTATPFQFSLDGSEVVFRSVMKSRDRDILELDVQVFVWGMMHGWAKSMHFGNAYAVFPFGIGRPSLKIGQQVVPFGLLAEYDTHGYLFQNPYALNLGERIDVGLSLVGILGPIDYWYMISNGNGLQMADPGDDKVHCLRIAEAGENPLGDMKAGISLLRGVLPDFAENPLWNMAAVPDTFIMKNRIGFDGEISLLFLLLRAELVAGQNGTSVTGIGFVSGYAEARLALRAGIELMAMYSECRPRAGAAGEAGEAGIGFDLNPGGSDAINLEIAGFRRDSGPSASYALVAKTQIRL